MEKASIVYDEITRVDVVDVASTRVYFKGGSCHMMRPTHELKVGNTVGIDTHGRVWHKD
jgi:hypothetical protein